jgi:hypothetical protein
MRGILAKEIAAGDITEPWPLVDGFEQDIEDMELCEEYADALLTITGTVVGVEQYNFWALIRATPEQRAQAFLKVTEAM